MFRQPRQSREAMSSRIELSVVDEETFSEEATGAKREEEDRAIEEELEKFSHQQGLYLQLLLRGGSPAAACQQMGIDLFTVVEYLSSDDEFRAKVDAVYDALSQNVAARLYQEAMKGSVPAMSQWLKNRPPPEWPDHVAVSTPISSLDVMSDEEIIRLARLENLAIPPELEANASDASRPQASEIIS